MYFRKRITTSGASLIEFALVTVVAIAVTVVAAKILRESTFTRAKKSITPAAQNVPCGADPAFSANSEACK
jgi:hypothetical protein